MTARELVQVIERAGGSLCLSPDGQKIRCELVEDVDETVELLHQHRDEVIAILRARRAELIGHWLHDFCTKNEYGEGLGRVLCREFCAWARAEVDVLEFLGALRAAGFAVDDDGYVHGLILRADDEAAQLYRRRVN